MRDVGDAVRTQRSGGQPEYEPIRAACNRLAQLFTCTYLLQRLCEMARDVCAAPRHSLREALYCVCVSLVYLVFSLTTPPTVMCVLTKRQLSPNLWNWQNWLPARAPSLSRGQRLTSTTLETILCRMDWTLQ